MLLKSEKLSESGTEQTQDSPESQREQIQNRSHHVASGYPDQYFRLYNMMFESRHSSHEIRDLIRLILEDESWQAVLAQEVSNDRIFNRRKSKEELMAFLRKRSGMHMLPDILTHQEHENSLIRA